METISCGGVVIHRGKVFLLYKNQNGRYIGWVLPKGTVEDKESFRQAALREVKEEGRINAKIVKYIGKTRYSFQGYDGVVNKTVHWYLMTSDSFYCKPQAEEYFVDAGYYKKHEAYHLLKFYNEKQIVIKAYHEYEIIKKKRRYNHEKLKRERF